jgi:hypothetical protein
MSGCIYLAHCLATRKNYIGQYCKPDPAGRWRRHVRAAINGSQIYFHRAIRKYGPSGFQIETVRVCPLAELGALEAYYAEQYDAYVWDYPGGLNSAFCGPQWALGIPKSRTHKRKIRESVIRSWVKRKLSPSLPTS